MRSLNECLGDGRAIPVQYDTDSSVLDSLKQGTRDELAKAQQERAANAAVKCAEHVSLRFNGKPCMGTSIHSRIPSFKKHLNFFFDEEYMLNCCTNASSPTNLEKCAGVGYFRFVQKFFSDHFYLYGNGCEGIRNGCTEQKRKMCEFHRNIENEALLLNGWRGKSVKRVLAPVPDYSENAEFHYCALEKMYNGDVTEKFGIQKDIVKDATKREKNDFCPRKQLEKLLESCGEADIQVKEVAHDDGSVSACCTDDNNTLEIAMEQLDSFVERFVGDDLRRSVENEVKRRYDQKVKAAITKKTNASAKAVEKAKAFTDINWDKHVTENSLDKLYVSQLNLYLMEELSMSKFQYDRKGYTKVKKIEDIKANFYSKNRNSTKLKGSLSTPRQTIISLEPSDVPTPTCSRHIQVPPWGGSLQNVSGMGTQTLKNTCPIDNYLTIFFVLMHDFKKLHQELSSSTELYAATLIQIKNLFDAKMFSEGKLKWLQLFPGRFDLTSAVIDLWGNEDDLFLSRLQSAVTTKYIGTCSSVACPAQQVEYVSHNITLR